MQLRVTKYGEPILRKKGERIEDFSEELVDLAENMLDTMYEEYGIGLAAQQVGEALQLCIVDVSHYEGDEDAFDYLFDGGKPPLDMIMPLAMVNPEVEALTNEIQGYEEGCLSFPEIRGNVDRPIKIRAKFQDLNGEEHTVECDGIFARCIQHEYDHLQGVLYIDHMSKGSLLKINDELRKLKKETKKWLKSQNKK